jgi:ribosomal protein S15P/S13E
MAKATQKPLWLKMSEEDLKKVILELADKYPPAQIGIILRDQYGVPSTKVYGKKLNAYLKELGIETNPDLENAEKKLDRIKEHMKNNVTDKRSKHKMQKAQTRYNILKKYFAKKKK